MCLHFKQMFWGKIGEELKNIFQYLGKYKSSSLELVGFVRLYIQSRNLENLDGKYPHFNVSHQC